MEGAQASIWVGESPKTTVTASPGSNRAEEAAPVLGVRPEAPTRTAGVGLAGQCPQTANSRGYPHAELGVE